MSHTNTYRPSWVQDRVGYDYGTGVAEGSAETYVVDIIQRHCGVMGVDAPAAAGWGDDTTAGGTWTIAPLDGGVPVLDGGVPPTDGGGVRPR